VTKPFHNPNVPIIQSRRKTVVIPKTFVPIGIGVAMVVFEAREFENVEGLSLPDTAQEKWESAMGLVVAVGPDVKQVKEGDVVLAYGDQVARTVKVNPGYRYVVLAEDRLSGVLTPEQKKVILEREGIECKSETSSG
jgi:co-chaperonin GroES (HSP10)